MVNLFEKIRDFFTRDKFVPTDEYYHFWRILIPTSRGTSEIDHLIVSRYGLFVIEIKDLTGWIFGTEKDAYWTAVYLEKKFQFQNPLRQNYGHLKALQEFLSVDIGKMHPLVVFSGESDFKTPMPTGVRKGDYMPFINSKEEILFDEAEFKRLLQLVRRADRTSGFFARWRHIYNVRRSHRRR